MAQVSPAGTQFTASLWPREELQDPSQGVPGHVRWTSCDYLPGLWEKRAWSVTCHFLHLPHVLGQPGSAPQTLSV